MPSCGDVPVNEDQLPVILPKHLKPKGLESLNRVCGIFKNLCPVCGKEARRETDTMDTFVDSVGISCGIVASGEGTNF